MNHCNRPTKIAYEALHKEISFNGIEELLDIFFFKKDLIVLSSSDVMNDHGRYSFICFDSFASFSTKNHDYYWNNKKISINDPFNFIKNKINKFKINKNMHLPPLQGGVVGYFSYEASKYLECLPKVIDNIMLPDIYLNFYSNIIAMDHVLNKCWIIATGFSRKKNI